MFLLPAPRGVPISTLSLFNSVGNAWHWMVEVGRLAPGESVLILGPGPRGLAATAIASQGGASEIVVAGLLSDQHRLAVASRLGATATVAQEAPALVAAIADALAGRKVDLVLDATSGGADLGALLPLVRVGGRISIGGLRNGREPGLSPQALDRIVLSEIQVLGARSTPPSSMKAAARLLARQDLPWDEVATDAIGLDDVAETMASLADTAGSSRRVHIRIEPNRQVPAPTTVND
jgi:threonine dehydrogenase-like Zn-dependent dehydrogenase